MGHYRQHLIEANPVAVYAALTTPEGLRGWWTQDCDVAPVVVRTMTDQQPARRKSERRER